MEPSLSLPDTDAQARRNVAVLVLAQAILGAQMPMLFIVGGLAGQSLAENPCWATLPISMIVLGSMLTATPMSALMSRADQALYRAKQSGKNRALPAQADWPQMARAAH